MPVYDLRLLGLWVATAGRLTGDAIRLLLLLNSADAFCVSNVFNLEAARTLSTGLPRCFFDARARAGARRSHARLDRAAACRHVNCRLSRPDRGERFLLRFLRLTSPCSLAVAAREVLTFAAPQAIGAGCVCALGGMLLKDYPGPKAQIHYADKVAGVLLKRSR